MTRYFLAVLAILLISPILTGVSVVAQQAESQEEMQIQAAPKEMPARTAFQGSAEFDAAMKLYRQRSFSQAIEALDAVLQSDPQNAAAYYFQGYAHYVLRHYPEALASFKRAFQSNPAFDPRPYF